MHAPALVAVAAGALMAAPAQADEQFWLLGSATKRLGTRGFLVLEVQPRLTGGMGRLGQVLGGPAIGLNLDRNVSVSGGYTLSWTNPPGRPERREHRFWQQVQVRLAGTPGKALLLSRTRLEQRLFENDDDFALRARHMLRGQVWLDEDWSLIATHEAFFGLESARWGMDAGLDQVRHALGVGHRLSRGLNVELAYLDQRFSRPVNPPPNQVITLTLLARFD